MTGTATTLSSRDDLLIRRLVLQPGEARTLEVKPGRRMVTVVADRGGILFNDRVSFLDDQIRTVKVERGRYADLGSSSCDMRGQRVAWTRR